MEALRRHRRQSFEDSAVASLLAAEGDEIAVRAWVRSAIPTALHLGFRTESDLLRLLAAQYAMRNSGVSVEMADLLADADLTPATKLTLLEARVVAG